MILATWSVLKNNLRASKNHFYLLWVRYCDTDPEYLFWLLSVKAICPKTNRKSILSIIRKYHPLDDIHNALFSS
jgi:hypothetical protein